MVPRMQYPIFFILPTFSYTWSLLQKLVQSLLIIFKYRKGYLKIIFMPVAALWRRVTVKLRERNRLGKGDPAKLLPGDFMFIHYPRLCAHCQSTDPWPQDFSASRILFWFPGFWLMLKNCWQNRSCILLSFPPFFPSSFAIFLSFPMLWNESKAHFSGQDTLWP